MTSRLPQVCASTTPEYPAGRTDHVRWTQLRDGGVAKYRHAYLVGRGTAAPNYAPV